jgi:hypothetical protein
MASTGGTGSPEGPDDINNRLAEIAAELAREARFKEPSAAERARAAAARPARKSARAGPLSRWRARRKTAELLKPADDSAILKPAPRPPTARQVRRARRAAAPRPFADRGYADESEYPSVARSVIAIIIIVALLVGAVIGLHYAFHHFDTASVAAGVERLTVNLIK